MGKIKAPWNDFNGNPIYLGDSIQHPDGSVGLVTIDNDLKNKWRVIYPNGDNCALVLQVGEKGGAVVEQAERAEQDAQKTRCPAGLTTYLRQYLHNDGSGIVFGYEKVGVDSLVQSMHHKIRAAISTQESKRAMTDAKLWSLIDAYADMREEYQRSTARHLSKQQRENMEGAKQDVVDALSTFSPNNDLVEVLLEYKRLYEEVQPAGGWQGVYEMGNAALRAAGVEA